MNRVRGDILSTDKTSYHGIFQFLNDQATFNLDFGANQISSTLSSSHKVAKEYSVHVLQKIVTYVNTSQVFLFCDIVRQQYVSTSDYDSRIILLDFSTVLFK